MVRHEETDMCLASGIPEAEIQDVVEWSVERMQLHRWADRVAKVSKAQPVILLEGFSLSNGFLCNLPPSMHSSWSSALIFA